MGHISDGDREAGRQMAFAADLRRLHAAFLRAEAAMRRLAHGEVTAGSVQDLAALAGGIEQGLEAIEAPERMKRIEALPAGRDRLLRLAVGVMRAGGAEKLGAVAHAQAMATIGYDCRATMTTNDICHAIGEYLDGPL